MVRIALIHGYAVGLTSPGVRPGFGETAGFRAFAEDIRSGDAAVFRWGVRKDVPWYGLLDPVAQYRFYRAELSEAFDPATQERLHAFMLRERPEIVVAHSMGTVLLHRYAQDRGLPSWIAQVVMVQSDLPRNVDLKEFPRTHNLYCPWDPTLLASAALSLRFRAGLGAVRGKAVTNVLFPAYRPPNLHTSALCDPRLREYVKGLCHSSSSSSFPSRS